MKRIAIACALSLVAVHAWAKPEDEKDDEDEDEDDEDEDEDTKPEPVKPEPKVASPKAAAKKEEFRKQDLRGHDVDAGAVGNPFQKDRFFVDKVDSEETENKTLVQGSLQWSNFAYLESSGKFPAPMGGTSAGSAASDFNRYFTDARLQTDFRHISGGRWDARIDMRGRLVNEPATTSTAAKDSADTNHVQSGFNGSNELELREAWLVRSGKRTDLFFGRQFVPDLGAIKIDGLRFDYASSEKITFLGFAGAYPVRGSRSLTTDYPQLRSSDGTQPLEKAGRLVGAGGFGAAYRTINMHGALGGVAIVPLSAERPRIYATSNGYLRAGTKLDFYHFSIVDLFGSNADPIALTNLSAGINYKPSQRLRLTVSFNRVDTETLNVQAGAFLDSPVSGDATSAGRVQNETLLQLKRISTNSARGSLSVGLGELNRFEVTIATQFRYRPALTLTPANNMMAIPLDPAKGVDVFGSVMDRRSFLNLRLGVDGSRSVAIGDTAFSRSEILAGRLFASREIGKGRGEWEGELSYAQTRDRTGTMITCTGPADCFGTSKAKVLSAGAQLYYRVKDNVFAIGNLWVSQTGVTRKDAMMDVNDPKITSVMGFIRLAYRF
jgi:hypothetical protein